MKKIFAGLGVVALAGSLALMAPMSASAWHSTITSSVKCDTTTSATITWHVQGYDTDETGTVTASTNDIVPVGTEFPGNVTKDFTQVVTAPGDQTLSVSMSWVNESATNEGSITVGQAVFDACTPPPVEVTPTVSFSYSAVCGSLTLTTVSTDVNADWYYGTKALVSGEKIGSAVLKGSGTKTTVIPFEEDSYGGSVEVDVETYASTEQDLLPDGWALGVQHLITVNTDCKPPVIVPGVCTTNDVRPTSTNLNQQGWVLKEGTAVYVPGGVQLTSTAWDGGKVTLPTNFKLSDAGAVAIDYTQGPGSGSVALLFNTSDGNQIHYEPFVGYTHPWFADQAGVFELGGGGQGSDWSDVDLSNLVSDPTVTSVVVGVWGGDSDVVTVHSASFNCGTQPFDFATAVVVVPPVTPVKDLAYTGPSDVTGWLVPIGGSFLLLAGITGVLRRQFNW